MATTTSWGTDTMAQCGSRAGGEEAEVLGCVSSYSFHKAWTLRDFIGVKWTADVAETLGWAISGSQSELYHSATGF